MVQRWALNIEDHTRQIARTMTTRNRKDRRVPASSTGVHPRRASLSRAFAAEVQKMSVEPNQIQLRYI